MSGACHRFLCWLSSRGLLSGSHRANGKVHSLKVQPERPWCPSSSALGALRQSSPLLPLHTQPHGTAGGAGASSLAREQGGFCSVNLGDTAVSVRCHGNSEGARADGQGAQIDRVVVLGLVPQNLRLRVGCSHLIREGISRNMSERVR